ncbi:hypothetical protein ACA910_000361 [Epithemia clementina (nom. ined.)]
MDQKGKTKSNKSISRGGSIGSDSTSAAQALLFRSAIIQPAAQYQLASAAADEAVKLVSGTKPPSDRTHHVPNGWRDPQITIVGIYYPLGPCQVRLPMEKLRSVLRTLVQVFRRLSLHVSYQDTPISATCQSIDQVEFQVSIFTSRSDAQEMIIEIERKCGDVVNYHLYAQNVTNALRGVDDDHRETWLGEAPCFWNRKFIDLADSIGQPSEDQDIKEALELAWNLIANDRYDARRLGLESLIHITDPNKSSYSVAKSATKCLMMPHDETEERISRGVFEYASRDVITNSDSSNPHSTAEADLCYLGLIVVSQTLQIAAESKSIDVERFLNTLSNDLVQCILQKMQHVRTHPHQAYYAVQSMVALCDCVPSLRSRVSNRDVEEAQLFGDASHLALATASQKLSLAL